MAHYELLVLVKPSLSDEEIASVSEKIRGLISRLGGEVSQTVNWGKKKLAYELRREKKAVYLIVRFEAEGTVSAAVERACRLHEHVLRTMVVAVRADAALPAAVGQGGPPAAE